jgi:ketosteroid isomerase-like protein
MMSSEPANLEELITRVREAMNAHDLEGLASCFSENYISEQPAHPDRAFTGTDQLRKNWSTVFKSVPDFKAELLRHAIAKDTVWSEWTWHGTRMDGHALDVRGVIILSADSGRFVHVSLYMEPVQPGAGIDAAVKSGIGAQ